MTILRRHLSTGYTVLPTATLEDARLSFRARGILAYLLAKPDTWKVAADRISKAGKEGVEAVRTALRELRDAGYYRVVTERREDGTFFKITEVYDQAQDWAAAEFREAEERRAAARRRKPAAGGAGAGRPEEGTDSGGVTETGFPGLGSPESGSPGDGSSGDGSPGLIGSTQSKYSEKNPPTPAAGAAGEPAPAAQQPTAGRPGSGVCPAHPAGGGRSCRGCGTSPRQQRADEERAKKDAYRDRERARDERTLSEVRSDGAPLSALAADAIAEMRLRTREVKEQTAQDRRQKRK
ncbi:hypothetical protein [Streptomyces sp. H34-S4]|uniref:hypothetical protein n=1 Tax=Streptomyces sp. H34-S4 TaxID=2996463 RepID=UPI00226E3DEF|nr:hypothetical protein [Streptomyces sp. H34-S4]MCY0939256.1 hypothetical protein [Streptomyces sp. H34-S4]